MDGVFILVAGALLVTPGVLTDAFGLLCLVPAFRSVAKRWLSRWLEKAVAERRVQMHFADGSNVPFDVVDVDPIESRPRDEDRSRN